MGPLNEWMSSIRRPAPHSGFAFRHAFVCSCRTCGHTLRGRGCPCRIIRRMRACMHSCAHICACAPPHPRAPPPTLASSCCCCFLRFSSSSSDSGCKARRQAGTHAGLHGREHASMHAAVVCCLLGGTGGRVRHACLCHSAPAPHHPPTRSSSPCSRLCKCARFHASCMPWHAGSRSYQCYMHSMHAAACIRRCMRPHLSLGFGGAAWPRGGLRRALLARTAVAHAAAGRQGRRWQAGR